MVAISPRVQSWLDAWQGSDADAVAALYVVTGRHESARIATAMPELGRSHLIGPDELRAYASRAFARLSWRRFEITSLTEQERFSVLEYLRHSPLDATPARVCEVLQWQGAQLIASRAYHF
ncbi:MAG: nuclear transport factor 2 family protein [Rhodospirillales bacterium]